MGWTHVVQTMNQWCPFVNTLMKLRVLQDAGISRLSERLLVSQAELCSLELDEE
jgi:hypothetical protein